MANNIEQVWQQCDTIRQTRVDKRKTPELIRIWDGDWNYVGTIGGAQLDASFQWRLNDTGTGYIHLRVDNWIAKWVLDYDSRPTKNVHVTMDKDGARWGGRLDQARVIKEEDGTKYVALEFLHDYEEVKHLYVWPNPFLPAAVQFPRSFVLVGPVVWSLKMALFLNIRRTRGQTWAFPDDPFDLRQWAGQYFPETWDVQVAPTATILSDSSPWTILSSRMKNFHELAAPKLADNQLMITTRRWLTGDPLPWDGAKIRNGCLVVDIVDKSGYWSTEGTATFGDVWKGLVRTTQKVIDTVDTERTILAEPMEVPEYHALDFLSTVPNAPYVVYRDGRETGVEASEFAWKPATDVQMITGGQSTYGVNEGISAAIMLAGNYLGAVIGLFSAGSIADAFLQPIYADTLLAWQSIKSDERARDLGWSHYYEGFADGADRAYTLNSIVALREAFFKTRERTSHQLHIRDGAPWFIGDNGQGHFFLGDRIGSTIEGLPDGKIVVEQVTEITYATTRDKKGWSATCGDRSIQQSGLENVMSKVRDAMGALHDLGVVS